METVHTANWIEKCQTHRVWYCDIGPLEHEEFLTAADLERHITSEAHQKEPIPATRLASMIRNNTTINVGNSEQCPICFLEPATAENIAAHLDSLANLSPENTHSRLTRTGLNNSSILLDFNTLSMGTAFSTRSEQVLSSHASTDAVSKDLPQPTSNAESGDESLQQIESSPTPKGLATSSGLDDLIDMILECAVESQLDTKLFLPRGRLHDLITESQVREALNSEGGPQLADIDRLTQFVLDHARRIFCILLLSDAGLQTTLRTLLEHGLVDNDLPIPKWALHSTLPDKPSLQRWA